MIGFRVKLLAGFGAILAVVLATGLFALRLLDDYSGMLERIFRENYDSVRYGQEMKEAAEEMDRAVRLHAHGDSSARGMARVARERFVANLRSATGNVTVAGEAAALAGLSARWTALDSELAMAMRRSPGAADPEALDRAWKAANDVRAVSQAIIDLNVGNIFSVDGQVKQGAARAKRTMVALLIGGALLSLALSSLVAAWVAGPVKVLTDSVREVGRGNLDMVVAIPSRDELGELAEAFNAMAAKLRDFRRSDRQRLWRIHRTTQNAIDSLPDAVAIVAPNGRVEMGNGAAKRLFGLEANSLLETQGEGLLVPYFRAAVETREAVQPKGFDAALQAFDGGERFFLPRAIPVLDPDGSVAGVTLVLADITQLRRLDELKSGALSVVAHELRTPLTSLRMASHLLLDERMGELSPRQGELAEGLRDDADRLWRIVEELLDIGRMDAGSDALDRDPLDLTELVKHGIVAREGAFREKGVKLVLDAASPVPPLVGDGARLVVALDNLLSNALRHTPSGGLVRIDLRCDADEVAIAVQDSGPGIPSEHLPRLFERFFRVPGQSSDTGVGLGLSIVREIVASHGGTVSAGNGPGVGARFVVRLPLDGRGRMGRFPEAPRA